MSKYILAFDQGTTSSRAILFDHQGQIQATSQKEFQQIFPKPGWVEHDPLEIWSTQMGVATEAISMKGLSVNDIAAIGITNQRETTVVWNKTTGQPIYNAIVWQDRRTADFCDNLKKQGHAKMVQEKTGLVIDSYFSGTKINWILDNVEGARDLANKGELIFGTIDTWLVWKLTNGKVHVTDVTNASRTMLFNIHTLAWDTELLKLLNVPISMLPEVKSSSEVYGHTTQLFAHHEIPIAGIAGDQQSALFGQMCTEPGMVKNTYGTGCFMLMHTGEKAVSSKNNLLTTIALQINGHTYYALEGSVFIGGAVVQWLRDGLHLIRNSSEVEALAKQVEETDGVYLVPAFAGLGAPYWNQHARGTIVGITRGTTSAHVARAALESIAFQSYDLLKAMEADAGIPIAELRVDGGATHNNLLMQFQSDIVNTKVTRPTMVETTALGAAYLAGLAVGFWKDMEELRSKWQIDKTFLPSATVEKRKDWIQGWERAIKATNNW
ncbi:MAG: glycerol kinase [Sediminibacterium sp.]|jgi:glycerol kinase|nr:MAG: glycerol kinase [Sediminibacterium sp.]